MSEIIKFTSIPTAYQRGLSLFDLRLACTQVSEMIAGHNTETREAYKIAHGHYPDTDEMLPKSPADLFHQLELGESVYIVERHADGTLHTQHHSSLYELLSIDVARRIGYQLFELGSAITRKASRGSGYGQQGADLRMGTMYAYAARHGIEAVAVTTVKRALTRHVWETRGAKILPFHDFTFAASQTCSCPNVSEQFHATPCEFRRPRALSVGKYAIPLVFSRGSNNYEMPCTLMSPDADELLKFEIRCRRLYRHLYGEDVQLGLINQPTFHRASEMFARIERMPEHKVRELITVLEHREQ